MSISFIPATLRGGQLNWSDLVGYHNPRQSGTAYNMLIPFNMGGWGNYADSSFSDRVATRSHDNYFPEQNYLDGAVVRVGHSGHDGVRWFVRVPLTFTLRLEREGIGEASEPDEALPLLRQWIDAIPDGYGDECDEWGSFVYHDRPDWIDGLDQAVDVAASWEVPDDGSYSEVMDEEIDEIVGDLRPGLQRVIDYGRQDASAPLSRDATAALLDEIDEDENDENLRQYLWENVENWDNGYWLREDGPDLWLDTDKLAAIVIDHWVETGSLIWRGAPAPFGPYVDAAQLTLGGAE